MQEVEVSIQTFADFVKDAKNPKWSSGEKIGIELDVLFAHSEGFVPFHATNYDDVPYGKYIFEQALKGIYGAIGDVTPITVKQITVINTRRKNKLVAEAENIITPLERAVKLGMATDQEIAALNAWEVYSVLLNRVDIAASDISWPAVPEIN